MYLKSLFKYIVLLVLLISNYTSISQNLLTNGDFQLGSGIGFNVNGSGFSQIFPPFSGNTAAGNWAITTNPQPMNTAFFIAGGDHTSGTGNMMVIDGTTAGGQQNFWEAGTAGSGYCGLTIGVSYTFSYWIKSVATTVTDAATQPNIGLQILSGSTLLASGNNLGPLPALGWQQVIYSFVATNSCVNIKLFNNNTNPVGNDFAIDDFSLVACLAPNVTCGTTTTSSITFNWVPVAGATGYTVSYQINTGAVNSLPTSSSLNLTVNSLNPGDQVRIFVLPAGSGCYAQGTQTCFTITPCPVPMVSVTQQPTCAMPTGTIVFTSPLNIALPIPSDLFISQVTDANVGSLTYIEIYNGTGASINLANYRLRVYNNGLGTASCD